MTLDEAIEFFDHWIPVDPISNRYQAWQTLRSVVLAQQTNNSDYAAALETLEQFLRESQDRHVLSFHDWLLKRLNPAKAPDCA